MAAESRLKIGVIGAGSWGTALANLLAEKGHAVTMWARHPEVARGINENHRNPFYLRAYDLPENLRATTDYREATEKQAVLVLVTPAQALREITGKLLPFLGKESLIVSCSKGIENETLLSMDEVLRELLPQALHKNLSFLSGPSFAEEVIRRMPTAVTIASANPDTAERAQKLFSSDLFRSYTSEDVVGVELGGALKNVIAVAAGMSDGLGFGHNSRAALITRGLGEIAKLGIQKGANPITFLGLAGMGDLILTCTSELSRNRQVGFQLGQGRKIDEILREMNMVAEGVKTAAAMPELARRSKVEMVICERVHDIVYRGADPKKIVSEIMTRSLKAEFPWAK